MSVCVWGLRGTNASEVKCRYRDRVTEISAVCAKIKDARWEEKHFVSREERIREM